MGRHDKPHSRLEIRCDGDIYERMERFREAFNELYEPKLTKTKIVESALEEYLNKYEHLVEKKLL